MTQGAAMGLETYRYNTPEQFIADLGERVIGPAEAKALELRGAKPETAAQSHNGRILLANYLS